jgi:hypothetical protein
MQRRTVVCERITKKYYAFKRYFGADVSRTITPASKNYTSRDLGAQGEGELKKDMHTNISLIRTLEVQASSRLQGRPERSEQNGAASASRSM